MNIVSCRRKARAAPHETDQPLGQERLHALDRSPHRRRGTYGALRLLKKQYSVEHINCVRG